MKKTFFVSAFLLFLLSIITSDAVCQKTEGEISYSFSLVSDMMPDMGANSMPIIAMKFKGDKEAMTIGKMQGIGMAIPIEKCIYDLATKQINMLIDKDGKKYDIIASQDEMKVLMKNKSRLNADSLKMNFVATDSIVTIMGYKCRKYTGSNSLMKVEMYTSDSDDLPSKMAGSLSGMLGSTGMGDGYEDVKGFIVKSVMHMDMMGMKMDMVMAVSKVLFKKVPDSEFEIPSNYKKVTYKEYQQIMSGDYIEK